MLVSLHSTLDEILFNTVNKIIVQPHMELTTLKKISYKPGLFTSLTSPATSSMSFTRHTDLSVPEMLLFLKLVPTLEPLYWCPLCLECIYISSWHGWLLCFIHVCLCESLELCPTLRDSMGSSPPGSSVHGILQARILEWVAISYFRDLPNQGPNPCLSPLLHWQTNP